MARQVLTKGKKSPTLIDKKPAINDKIRYKRMSFEGCGYSGLYFSSADIDYLNAKVFIEPVKTTRKISIRSQIYAGDDAFSKVFTDIITLKPGDTCFTTTGWGNKNFNCYRNRVYQWRVEIDGTDVYCQDFRFYTGKIDKIGLPIKDVKLFASKASGALESDRDKYAVLFDSSTLEYVYFKCFINEPGTDKLVQLWLKVIYLEDDTVFYDDYFLQDLDSETIGFWEGIGYSSKRKWKKGLYKYTIRIGSASAQEGTFTVY